ncbi:MAG: PaaI family thioesterase [Thermoplasmatota archaeon]
MARPPNRIGSIHDLIQVPPFHAWLGVRLESVSEERATLRVPYRPELIGNPLIPAIHGGILAALIDLAGGVVLFAQLGIPTPTIDMRIDYLRPALAELDLVAEARAVSVGATIAYVDIEVRQIGRGQPWNHATAPEARLVATGRCVYSTKERGSPPARSLPIG